jgi:mono/diheme cytochrome c family protein
MIRLLAGLALFSMVVSAQQADNTGFAGKIQPFLAKNCYGCHNAKLQSGGLNLAAFADADAVAKDHDHWQLILEKLQTSQMPPKALPRPPAADVKTVTAWIAAEFDREDSLIRPDPGHITARRLNRTEYNNTVRDLLGVNFQPATDFPPDDTGYGFDNIGDVLSMSPALMDRYLSAAEKVARTAIYGVAPLKPTLVKHEPWYVDFDQRPIVKFEYDKTGLSLPSALHVMHTFPAEGDYDIAGLLRGTRPDGSEPLQVAYWIDGRQVKTVDYPVPPGGEVSGQRKEFRIHMTAGEHEIAVSILDIFEGLPPAYKGPNPSTLPQPKPRAFGRGRGPRKADPNAPTNNEAPADPVAAAKSAPKFGQNGALPRFATTAFFVSNLEVIGPYNQVKGPAKESLERIFICKQQTAGCARKILANLAGRAYRRPATDAEVKELANVYAMVRAGGDSFDEGICLAIQKLLISPYFLFRIEQNRGPGIRPVSDYELATRLSYFLWSTMPDAGLTRLAHERRLHRPEVLKAEVKRMVADPKSQALVDDFGGQWLEFRGLESHIPDRKKFQEYTDYTRMSLEKETELFFNSVMHEDRSVLDFIDGKYTFLNERLADFYGISGVKGPEFRKVDLTGTKREGVLTQGSVLTVSSYANRTSPVIRGKWVLENILNSPPPPPPPDVPSLDEAAVGTTVSMRVQLEKHRANPVCASCHSRMDPLGFSLENYDAIGQWRDKDGKFLIDASGQLPDGRKFKGASGLVSILMSNPNAFAQAMTEKMLIYALGRGLESYDRPAVKQIEKRLAANDYRFSALLEGIVTSLPFLERDAKGVVPAERESKKGSDVPHA